MVPDLDAHLSWVKLAFWSAQLLSLGLVAAVCLRLGRRMSLGGSLLSPIFYFAALSWLAFPLHAFLLYQGWADTQQQVVFSQKDLTAALWLSLACLLVVYWGARLSSSPRLARTSEAREGDGVRLGRLSFAITALIMLAVFFLMQTIFKTGSFMPFVGNEQNEIRVGNGPLFALSELFVYGLIAAVPGILEPRRWTPSRVVFLLAFAAGLGLAVYMGIALTSRRIIALPLFALALAWLYTRRRINTVLAALLITATVVGTPSLQALRYALAPTQTPSETEVIVGHCRLVGQHPAPQRALVITSASGSEREISDPAARVARELCDPANNSTYFFVQTVASTYGMADHLAAYWRKATPMELATGIDRGIAWTYNLLLALVPRAIWSDKPMQYGSVAEQRWLYPHMYESSEVTMTLPPSFIIDFLFGFGLVSLFALCFGLGRLLAWAHTGLHRGLHADNRMHFILSVFLMAYLFNLVRSGTGFAQPLIQMLLVLVLMYGMRPLRQLFTRPSA